MAAAAATSVAYLGLLGYRSDYLAHFISGFSATMLLLAMASCRRRPVSLSVPLIVLSAIGLGIIAESTVFRPPAFDRVDVYNQSLGAVLAGACLVGRWGSPKRTAALSSIGLLGLLVGFYFAFHVWAGDWSFAVMP
jgi:hypothetical protein